MGLFRMKKSMPESLAWVLRILLIASIPVVLSLTNVRLLMTPLFPDVIYNLPGFPDDYYGLTKADRLHWSKQSIQYILNDPAVGDLADWKFADGVTAPPDVLVHRREVYDAVKAANQSAAAALPPIAQLAGLLKLQPPLEPVE